MTVTEILTRNAASNDVKTSLTPSALAAFETYYEFLEREGKRMNLTAITGPEDVACLHFLDSIALLGLWDFANKSVLDVGSGAGFPGLPLRIAEPTISLTLLDATEKRVDFLRRLCHVLEISGVNCLHDRAEEAARTEGLRASFDIVTSRAVARLNVLCELCLPFVRRGGVFIAMKGTDSDGEISEAKSAAGILGGELAGIHDYRIVDTEICHRAVIFRKIQDTPSEYPRRFAKIQKSPL